MFFPIFLELIARVCFSSIAIVNKFSRKAGVTTQGVMAQNIWAIPFMLVLAGALYWFDNSVFNLPFIYWRTLALWIVLCVVANYVLVFLSRYQALTELGGYKLGLNMVASVIIDYMWYGVADWSPFYIVGGALAVTGGILLSTRPVTQTEKEKRIPLPFPLWQVILMLLALAWIAPIGYALYKDCLSFAGNQPLVHTVIGQTILFAAFWFLGSKDYKTARRDKTLPNWRVGVAVFCVIVAAVAQTYSIAALNITTLMVLGFLSGAIVTLSDILSGEVTPNKRNLASIGLVFAGSIIIGLSR